MGFRNGSLVFGYLLLLPACGSETARSPIDPGQSSTGSGSDAGTGGTGGGSCAATVACPGTMSGPWCVEHLPVDPNSSSLTGVWSDRADDVWVSGYTFTVSTAATVTAASGFIFHWDGCAWSFEPAAVGRAGAQRHLGRSAQRHLGGRRSRDDGQLGWDLLVQRPGGRRREAH